MACISVACIIASSTPLVRFTAQREGRVGSRDYMQPAVIITRPASLAAVCMRVSAIPVTTAGARDFLNVFPLLMSHHPAVITAQLAYGVHPLVCQPTSQKHVSMYRQTPFWEDGWCCFAVRPCSSRHLHSCSSLHGVALCVRRQAHTRVLR